MKYKAIAKTLSALILILSLNLVVPFFLAIVFHETKEAKSFLCVISLMVVISLIVLFLLRKFSVKSLSPRDGFFFVTASWVLASLFGALPFYFSGAIPLFCDAFFETMSGFTTTGASILTDIEALPKSMLFWRSQTHWLGGMGIVVLTVAIMPLLGIGGLQLIKAEAPGPTVDRLTPRITGTAKILWGIYLGYTVIQTTLLYAGGMTLFDAITHSFGTLATGGFSTKNASIAHYKSPYIENVTTVFMVLAGINFTVHYRLLTGRFKSLFKDGELIVYLLIFFGTTAAISLSLYSNAFSPAYAVRLASFQAASILTTTGFASADYLRWPMLAQALLFFLMFIGGCSGSTGGGVKVIRIVTLLKKAINEMKYLVHPRGTFTLKVSGTSIKKDISYAISGFFFLYITMLVLTTLVVTSANVDLLSAFTTALATLGNIGPGFGRVGPVENYSFYPPHVKWFLSFAMMTGRLELYTVLVLFTPVFWKR